MFYDLECPKCDTVSEHMMSSEDTDKWVECPECSGQLCRRYHRRYNVPMIQGDTVAGGVNYSYFDTNLQVQIKNKQHRKDVMAAQGVREYSPSAESTKNSNEVAYIRKNAAPDEQGKALADVKGKLKTEQRNALNKRIDKSFAAYNSANKGT